MEKVILNNSVLRVTISTFGAEVTSVIYKDEERIWQGNEKFWTGHSPLLFPVCGAFKDFKYTLNDKTYDMQPHGFVRKATFEVVNQTGDSVTMRLIQTPEQFDIYPFKYEFLVTYTIENNKLSSRVEVENKQAKPIYFSFGSHESFNLKGLLEDYSVEFEKEERFLSPKIDGRLLMHEDLDFGTGNLLKMTKDLFAFDTFVLRDVNSRSLNLLFKGERVAHFDFDASNILIWQPKEAPFLCIEPWFRAPDYVDTCFDITKKPKMIKVESFKNFVSNRSVIYF
ncbi:MAG: hypothetical protein IKJ19_06490 [Clostridia bacterium]|nr:hypothetical protein [Clostridia bacterium]